MKRYALVLLILLPAALLAVNTAYACHGDCGGAGPGCAQACDEGGMAGYSYCVDTPANGYGTDWGVHKQEPNDNCGGWGNCTLEDCPGDFECNGGYYKCGGGCCEEPSCASNEGQACQSAPNACGMRNNGTIQCDGSCSASTPPNSSCPAPSCSAAPANQAIGQPVVATRSGGVGPFTWTSAGGVPATGSGNQFTTSYAATGVKSIGILDTGTGKSGSCSVTICVATYNQACQSAPNGCDMRGTGTIQCDGTCNALVPPNSACPAPTCSISPATATTGQIVTATGSNGVQPYTWTGGGNPASGTGPSFNTLYSSNGTKTLTITDSNAKSGTCTVNIGYAFITTGTVITAQGQPGTIDFDTDYSIRVKVWDADDRESAWSAPFAYSTKPGPWPDVDFSYVPSKPAANQNIQFTDETLNDPVSWAWDFGDGAVSTDQNPAHIFGAEGPYSVTLSATNATGTCSASKSIGVTKPIPTYREVRPGQQPSPSPEQRTNDSTGGENTRGSTQP